MMRSRYLAIRGTSLDLCQTLEPEDFVIQTMPDVSPAKWHLAHVTWFFERFVLEQYLPGYDSYDNDYHYLFNSYYNSAGSMHPRPKRGLLSRPLVREIVDYREHVDEHIERLLESDPAKECLSRIELGLNHEQQHQELLLTDIKHVFSCNPLEPAVMADSAHAEENAQASAGWIELDGGLFPVGHDGDGFCFDNELPRHDTLMQPSLVADRLVTNGEFREFIQDGGYSDHRHWLSDGWAAVNEHNWQRPLYWDEALESEFTLTGRKAIDDAAPVTHVSLYEADAYARWAGARLPSEFEWERCAAELPVQGNLLDSGNWHPVPGGGKQFFGDVWEWTASAYSAYPGFKPLAGSLGEYNGKFMCNQATVRGGSCVTSSDHIRASYRSFFYPHQRWQFLGVRLAKEN